VRKSDDVDRVDDDDDEDDEDDDDDDDDVNAPEVDAAADDMGKGTVREDEEMRAALAFRLAIICFCFSTFSSRRLRALIIVSIDVDRRTDWGTSWPSR
jgi:hypothetical protein